MSRMTVSPDVGGKIYYNRFEHSEVKLEVSITDTVTFFKPTGLDDGGEAVGVIEDGTDGEVVVQVPGLYLILAKYSVSADVSNFCIRGAIFVDGVEIGSGQAEELIQPTIDISDVVITDRIKLDQGQTVDIRFQSPDGSGDKLLIYQATIMVGKL